MIFIKKQLSYNLCASSRFINFKNRFEKFHNECHLEDFKFAELDEQSLEKFFFKIGSEEIKNYKQIVNKFCNAKDIKTIPESFSFVSGWTKYKKF